MEGSTRWREVLEGGLLKLSKADIVNIGQDGDKA
eukprot:CAMPEP_0206286710 /NCGR_PEP_ID=MMETSP0106_2-20121207/739_1 /ASSEMBLY_ACC=CAM_ASM_000206 /TAXON_ID=81532 /ORGANISM="Acanthoeca-like sp., Strain 10tr" /LENGTH=33 /DNA_ID= /DNA_START= /DNA_END= /DNA_ORIENTATION=